MVVHCIMDKSCVCCLTINFRTQKLFGLKTCNTTWFASFISFARSVGRRWNVAVEFVGASLESVRREFSLQPVAANVEVAARIRQRSHHHQNQPFWSVSKPLLHQRDHENFCSPWICPWTFRGICQTGFFRFVWHFHQYLSGQVGAGGQSKYGGGIEPIGQLWLSLSCD